jgi:hypothetical protein
VGEVAGEWIGEGLGGVGVGEWACGRSVSEWEREAGVCTCWGRFTREEEWAGESPLSLGVGERGGVYSPEMAVTDIDERRSVGCLGSAK